MHHHQQLRKNDKQKQVDRGLPGFWFWHDTIRYVQGVKGEKEKEKEKEEELSWYKWAEEYLVYKELEWSYDMTHVL